MEPERKIENLLRAYAKKRRAEAGDALKLHPATRRLLQGEAASTLRSSPATEDGRRAPRPGKAGTPGFFLAVFRRRLVFALCVVATAFIGVSLFRPAWNPAKKGAQSVSAMNNLRQTGTATNPYAGDNKHVLSASLDELTNQKSAEFVLAEKVAPETLAKAAPGAPMAVATPPPALEVAGDLEKSNPVGGASQPFAQTGTVSHQQNRYRNVSVAAPTAPVMQSFQVLQNGDAISVVDWDGSVYQGSIQVAAAVEHNGPVPAPGEAVVPLQIQTRTGPTAVSGQPANQYYFFRVAGTNQTLKQNVVFSGNMEAISGAPANTQPMFGSGIGGGGIGAGNQLPQTAANASQQNWRLNSRIVGTVIIDDTNRIEINAVPVAP
jgi:hypothetical protein